MNALFDGRAAAAEQTVRRHPRVVSHRLAGEQAAVLLHLDTSAYHSINNVGALIWELLEEPLSLAELEQQLAALIGDPPASLAADIDDFLTSLAARGLIEVGSRQV